MLETLETPVHSEEKKIVLKAISDSPGQISVADISTKTGLPVLKSTELLNQIAYETGGHLTVGTAGSIAYEFDRNIESAYIARSSRNFFLRMRRIIVNAALYLARMFALIMFFLIRVSFGIMLILGVVLIIVLVIVVIAALLAKTMSDEDSSMSDFDFGGVLGGMGGIFRYWAFDWLWDWWYWGDYLRSDPYRYREIPTPQQQDIPQLKDKKDKESFLDKCFSYLFGDGDPNTGLEERYWQTLGLVLKANNGVVVAEQLAPYANVSSKNEDWVLPILVRFNGTCEVSESGSIIYIFPSFQQDLHKPALEQKPERTSEISDAALADELHQLFNKHLKHKTSNHERNVVSSHLDPYLKERHWEFSHVSDGTRTTIICLAVFLIVGGIWLSTMVVAVPFLIAFTPLLLAMSAYGAMFLLVPWIRSMIIAGFNSKIEERNAVRYAAANKLHEKDPALRTKLLEAEKARVKAIDEASSESIAFTTEKDSLEQQFDDKT